jgi:hypothetical protein
MDAWQGSNDAMHMGRVDQLLDLRTTIELDWDGPAKDIALGAIDSLLRRTTANEGLGDREEAAPRANEGS